MRTISLKRINAFKESLIAEEKAQATINKYTKDVMYFNKWLLDKKLDKNNVLKYKDYLIKKYSVSSVNVIPASARLDCITVSTGVLSARPSAVISRPFS